MPTVAISGQTTFGANTSGTTTQLDNNFLLCLNALNNFNQYTNYLADSGAANAYVVTCPASTTLTLSAGAQIQFKASAANTGASTLNANGTGATNILNMDGTALVRGQIIAGAIVSVMYDGTQFLLLSQSNLVWIQSQTAANVAALDFTSGIGSIFNEYLFTFTNLLPATDDSNLYIRVSEDAGSTFKAGGTDYGYAGNQSTDGAANSAFGSTGASQILVTSAISSTASSGGASGEIRFFAPSGTTQQKQFTVQAAVTRTNVASFSNIQMAGRFKLDTNAINGVRFLMSAGNITSGTVSLYGVKK